MSAQRWWSTLMFPFGKGVSISVRDRGGLSQPTNGVRCGPGLSTAMVTGKTSTWAARAADRRRADVRHRPGDSRSGREPVTHGAVVIARRATGAHR